MLKATKFLVVYEAALVNRMTCRSFTVGLCLQKDMSALVKYSFSHSLVLREHKGLEKEAVDRRGC